MIFWLLAGPRDGARVGAMNEVAASAGWYPHTTYLYGVAGRSLSLRSTGVHPLLLNIQ